MSEHQGLRFEVCLEPQQPTVEWLTELLRRLWERGLSYSHLPVTEETWQMEMDTSSCQVSTKGGMVSGSLRDCVHRLIEEHGGVLPVFAGHVQMDMGLDSYTWEVPADGKWARWLSLSIERVAVDPIFADIAAAEQGAYLRVYHAFVQWSEILSELAQPLYGFGYNPRDGVADERGLNQYLNVAHAELYAGRLPQLRQWLKGDAIQYIAPTMATPALLTDLLDRTGYQIRRLANGGIFVVPRVFPFTEEDALAYRHFTQAETAIKTVRDMLAARTQGAPGTQGQDSNMNYTALREAVERAKAQYRRALDIFEATGDELSAQRTRTRLAGLEPLIERLSALST